MRTFIVASTAVDLHSGPDITIANFYVDNFIKNWHVSEEMSCSDHRYIQFTVTGIDRSVEVYRNPRRTDWESFRTELLGCLCKITDKITDFADLEQFQDAVTFAYKENCPLTVGRNNRNMSWWNQDLAERRRNVRRLFNAAKKAGTKRRLT
jgi:hypothetical protein